MKPTTSAFNDLMRFPGWGIVPSSWREAYGKGDFPRMAEIGMRWLAEAPTNLSVEQRATRLVCAGYPLIGMGDPKGEEFLREAFKSFCSFDRTAVDAIEGVWLDVAMKPMMTFFGTAKALLGWLSVFEDSWKARDKALSSLKKPDPFVIDIHTKGRANYHVSLLSMLVSSEAFAEARDILPKVREHVAKVADSGGRMDLESEIDGNMAKLLMNDGPSHYDEALKLPDQSITCSRNIWALLGLKAELLMKMGRVITGHAA